VHTYGLRFDVNCSILFTEQQQDELATENLEVTGQR
jgi:hypothetical protein